MAVAFVAGAVVAGACATVALVALFVAFLTASFAMLAAVAIEEFLDAFTLTYKAIAELFLACSYPPVDAVGAVLAKAIAVLFLASTGIVGVV